MPYYAGFMNIYGILCIGIKICGAPELYAATATNIALSTLYITPTTSQPTTAKPKPTAKPTTSKPTTSKPTTAKPTTAKPKGIFGGIFRGIYGQRYGGIYGCVYGGIYKGLFGGIYKGLFGGIYKGLFGGSFGGIYMEEKFKKYSKCDSFRAIAAIECLHAIHKGTLNSLSEQHLVDCVGVQYGCMGCINGGQMTGAMRYAAHDGGLCSESEYKYTTRNGQCEALSCGTKYDGKG